MKCLYCGSEESKVIDSRSADEINSIRRRRECLGCGRRFTTYETIETTPVLVVKSTGEREPFDANKIRRGIIKACEKRPVSLAQIDEVVDRIEKQISGSLDREIESKKIGELVMQELKGLDEVAYVRFASVYKQFKDVSTFMEFISGFESLLKDKKD